MERGSLNRSRSSESLLELREVSVVPSGSQHPLLSGVNLVLERGQVGVLLGANGSGKTTLLRVAAGLHSAASGEVLPYGTGFDPGRVALVLEDPISQFVAGTVTAEIEFTLESRGLPAAEIIPRRDAALETFGLGRLAEQDPRRLSAGEQARTLLAAALVWEPEVLLLDDALLYLGPGEAAVLWRGIRTVVHQGRVGGVILAGSESEFAVTADRVGWLVEGRLAGWEPPAAAFHAPLPEGVAPPLTLWLERRLREGGVKLSGDRLDLEGFIQRLADAGWVA